MIGTADEVAPYKGAKPHYLITEKLDDRDWLSIAVTARDLDSLKPRKPKALAKSTSRSRQKQP